MTLLELCEPLLLYVCRLSRSARKGAAIDERQARGEVLGLFADMKAQAARDPRLADDYNAIELPLMFFVDSMIAESDLPFAAEWNQNRLAFEHNELAGDEKFFDVLEETLEEKTQSAKERLAVLYACLGLGFTGFYAGQPEYLRSKMMECSVTLRDRIDTDEAVAVTPQAYDHLDTRDLVEPPAAKIAFMAVVLLCVIVSIVVLAVVGYESARKDLQANLEIIAPPAGPQETAE